MRVSKTFNRSNQIPLVIQTLANDKGSANALGQEVAEHLEEAKDYFSNSEAAPNVNPDNKAYRDLILPILDAFLEKTDPTFEQAPQGVNPSSEHAEWIIKIYADRAAKDQPILSEDLSDIHDEISYFKTARNALEEKAKSTLLDDYASYEDFTKVITPMKLKHEQKSEQKTIVDEIKAETTMLYQGEEGSIVVPHTVQASQFWGQTTKWCISGDEADTHFTETYNPQSPCLMYVPKTSKLETMDGDVISGKVAVVNNEIYNEADNTETKLPDYILPLRDAAVRSAALGKSEYIQLFGDIETKTQSNQQPSPSRSCLEDLPQEQQSLLKSIDGKPDQIYGALFLNHQELAKDKKFVLAAIQQDATVIFYAHDDLRKDEKIVLAAIQQNKKALKFAHEDLPEDKKFMLAAVQQEGTVLEFAHEDLRKDEKIVLAAVQQDGIALFYAHDSLKKNKDIVLAAAQQEGRVLEYAHRDLRKDKDIVLAAVQQDGRALEYAHEDFRKDEKIVFAAVQQDGRALEYAHEDFRKDKNIVLAAVQQDGRALEYAHEDFRKDEKIVLTAVQQDGKALECAHENLFKNKDFVESILDIAENADKEEKHKILNQLHRIPAFYGHITADIGDLRTRLTEYNLEQKQSPDVPEILLYDSVSTEQHINL